MLHLIHLEEPHAPWIHLPGGRTYTELSAEFDDGRPTTRGGWGRAT